MTFQSSEIDERLAGMEIAAGALRVPVERSAIVGRWRADVQATRFHCAAESRTQRLLAILGGTGTGKSTLVNRLLDANLSAASFRRTFTSGAVALTRHATALPAGFLGIEHVTARVDELPARGRADALVVIGAEHPLLDQLALIDTPDLDGDQPLHHAQADRAFRWVDAVLFLVTPEKYQMTELVPYYRLAQRYALPVLFVMNKVEDATVVEDFAQQLSVRGFGDARVYALPRDEAAYEPPAESGLPALREALGRLPAASPVDRQRGLKHRTIDLLNRLQDQIIQPLREDRRQADAMIESLRSLGTPPPGVDVHPLTLQLQRRMQQKSVLYLMGPQRMLERVRQVPGMLARLPRTTFDLIFRGRAPSVPAPADPEEAGTRPPDFRQILSDQFAILQSRIDDVIRSTPAGEKWLAGGVGQTRIPPESAGKIAEEELADLQDWLEKKWNATPRDTKALHPLLKVLPGGEKLAKWSETAPYLLVLVSLTTSHLFGFIDQIVLGGYTAAVWLGEKLSNEVSSRAKQTNRRIIERFTQLAQQQIDATIAWVDAQTPSPEDLSSMESRARELAARIGM